MNPFRNTFVLSLSLSLASPILAPLFFRSLRSPHLRECCCCCPGDDRDRELDHRRAPSPRWESLGLRANPGLSANFGLFSHSPLQGMLVTRSQRFLVYPKKVAGVVVVGVVLVAFDRPPKGMMMI